MRQAGADAGERDDRSTSTENEELRRLRKEVAISSHWPFEQWGRFLPEHTTAVSLLDRLLHHAHVVVTDGESYRMRHARAKGAPPATSS